MANQFMLHFVAGLLLLYVIFFAVYRLIFHPLAKFPGPKIAALTRFYEAYYDVFLGGRYTFKIKDMHRDYGPLIRISPHELHINDPAFYEKLYNRERWNKYDWVYDAFAAEGSTLCTMEHDAHRKRRALLNIFFSKANTIRNIDIVARNVKQLCARIGEASTEKRTVINVGSALSAFSRDVAGELVLGHSGDSLKAQDFDAALTRIFKTTGVIWRITKHVRWFGPLLKKLPITLIGRLASDGLMRLCSYQHTCKIIAKDAIAMHEQGILSNANHSHTFLNEILMSSQPPGEKSATRVGNEITAVVSAASETTAHTLSSILYHVYTDLTILSRLRAELAAEVGRDFEFSATCLSRLEKLPLLTAVLTEGLRLSPGIATRMARIAPDRDLFYEHWRIPAGTPVSMTTLLLHLNEDLYPEPQKFDPDRWISTDTSEQQSRIFAPFAKGTRMCPGMHLAWTELYLAVAAVITRFDLDLYQAGPKDVEVTTDQFVIGTEDVSGIKAFVSQLTEI